MYTIKQLKEKKTLRAKRIMHGYKSADAIRKILDDDGIKYEESAKKFELEGGSVILKPALPAEMSGTIIMRSKDFVFKPDDTNLPPIYGMPIKSDYIKETGLLLPAFGGKQVEYIFE